MPSDTNTALGNFGGDNNLGFFRNNNRSNTDDADKPKNEKDAIKEKQDADKPKDK
jgi:hypothetical protein